MVAIMNMSCNPLFDMRLSQEDLRKMFERNHDLAKRNQVPTTPIVIANSLPMPKNKYGNIKVEYNGIRFDSKKELRCWQGLKLREKAGEISNLCRQMPYDLIVNEQKIGRLTLDFVWLEKGRTVVADCKSPATKKETSYRIRKKIFEAQYAPLVILEL